MIDEKCWDDAHLMSVLTSRPQVECYEKLIQERKTVDLESQLHQWQEREAAVCPEDVGFEEYIKALQSQLQQEREKRKEAEAENTKLLKEGTIAMNGLFLLSQSIIRRGLVDDERCPECTRKPKFIHCLACQPGRWLEAGEEMYNDPETKAWSESAKRLIGWT